MSSFFVDLDFFSQKCRRKKIFQAETLFTIYSFKKSSGIISERHNTRIVQSTLKFGMVQYEGGIISGWHNTRVSTRDVFKRNLSKMI